MTTACLLRVSVGARLTTDRDLDDALLIGVTAAMIVLRIFRIARPIATHGGLALQLSLNQQFHVNRAVCIAPETVMECMIQLVDVEGFATPRIGAVQKRTMLGLLGRHNR